MHTIAIGPVPQQTGAGAPTGPPSDTYQASVPGGLAGGHIPHHATQQTPASHPLLAPCKGRPGPDDKPILVLIHGFGSGAPLWFHNFDVLSRSGAFSRVFALDWLGVGQSHRPRYPKHDPVRGEVRGLPGWAQGVGVCA